MHGQLALILHAHLPFVRHPEHERFLEESWFYEGVIETYLPLLQKLKEWQRDELAARITLTITPTLCSMLRDPLLQARCTARLDNLVELSSSEVDRTRGEPAFHALAGFYHRHFSELRKLWHSISHDLINALANLQRAGRIEIITCAATHALLPLLIHHPPSIRAQILTACEFYRDCFGCDPKGMWLPECAYDSAIEPVLQAAGIRWFALEAHGLLHANPRPRFSTFSPVITPNGLAAFGRDLASARQVWSRTEGYPGDPRYRDFYRDIGFDQDFEYVQPCLPSPEHRGFTGIKYHRITGNTETKHPYERGPAMDAVTEHAEHFVQARIRQVHQIEAVTGTPPLLLMPYDAELFGHWWYEGLEFLDAVVRKACRHPNDLKFITPGDYLIENPTHQIAAPEASSWGEHGYYKVWLNETNDWIPPHLNIAQERMTQLAQTFQHPTSLQRRALNQAARELMLAQASDWPFILRTGTSPDYAKQRVQSHLLRFNTLYDQLSAGIIDEAALEDLESKDNIFPNVDYRHFA